MSVKWVAHVVLAALVPWMGSARAGDSAVILQYHHFGSDTPPATSVTLEQFDAHLSYLDEQGYVIRPLAEIVAALQAGQALPDDCIAITIDDAYASVYEHAWVRLQARGWHFTVFVTTGGVDDGLRAYMTWDQMRELTAAGVTFANHSHTHDYLIRRRAGESEAQRRGRVMADLRRCQERLQAELGSGPDLFAYPYGEYDAALKEIVRGLGFVGLGQHSGPIWAGSDFGALPRFPMSVPYADMDGFIAKVRSRPLPVLSATPDDPVLPSGVTRPVLRLELGAGDYQASRLAAYAGGQGAIDVRWIDRERRIVEVTALEPLPVGRSRYNCTAPHTDGTRYFWFSQLWIREPEGGY